MAIHEPHPCPYRPHCPSASANYSIDRITCMSSACPNFLKHFICFPLLQGGNPVTWLARPRLTLLGSPLLSGGSAPSCIGPQHRMFSAQNALPAWSPWPLHPARVHKSGAFSPWHFPTMLFLRPTRLSCLPKLLGLLSLEEGLRC